jgi:ABC-type amino acid transport system permease subunit
LRPKGADFAFGADETIREQNLLRASDLWIETAGNTPALFQIYLIYFVLASLGITGDPYALVVGITFNNT